MLSEDEINTRLALSSCLRHCLNSQQQQTKAVLKILANQQALLPRQLRLRNPRQSPINEHSNSLLMLIESNCLKAFFALANIADASDGSNVTITVSATKNDGYDPVWLRNAVEEPLQEARHRFRLRKEQVCVLQ